MQATFVDRTERKRAEEKLRESEQLYRTLAESFPDDVFILGRDTSVQYMNGSGLKHFGLSLEEIAGKKASDLFPPEEAERVAVPISRAFQTGEQIHTENTVSFQGAVSCRDEQWIPLRTGSGTSAVLGISRDITERVEYETRLLTLHTHASQLSSAKDIDTIARHTLDAIELTLGFEHADFLLVEKDALQMRGRRGIPVVFSAQPLNGRGLTVKAANTKTTLRILDTRKEPDYVDPKGYDWPGPSTILSELIVPVITDGEVVAVLCVDSTRTDSFNDKDQRLLEILAAHVGSELRRLKHEEKLERYSENLEELVAERTSELRLSEMKYRIAIDFTYDWEQWERPDGSLNYVSPSCERITGYTAAEFLANSIRLGDLILGEDKEKWAAYQRGDPTQQREGPVEFRIQRKDGSVSWIEHNCNPVYDDKHDYLGVRSSNRDITQRKKLEAYLSDAQRLIAIGQTAAMVGHDLRNPLQAIATTMDLLRRQFESTPTDQKKLGTKLSELEMVKMIQDAVRYMDKVVSDLQSYAEPRILELAQVDLNQLLNESIFMAHIPSNIKVSVSVTESYVLADPVIERVFVNLLLNAVQAMPKGGELTIGTERQGKHVLIHFQDTGVGIPVENLPKLFDPLFTTKAKGQGLGLAVCKRIVDAHEGSISVESTVGKGSTFTVRLLLGR